MRKAEYQVSIESCDNGLIVRVGCKTVIVTEDKIDEALQDIKQYLTTGYPGQREVRKKWLTEEEDTCEPTCCTEPPALAASR